ncbi:hypothetical protein Glove_606g23 [Diversispora epigaea]|uniref:Uncharacterized protein n=1 Tax=Diversispora epigaea TaxID=1348612 RepID=A0A397G8H2_9GLOM|nr:hypothetical protein Glove_606g23 [Diversispora epigaea]
MSKYLGPSSRIRRPDFLKTPEPPQGLELDIPYYDYSRAGSIQERYYEDPYVIIPEHFRELSKTSHMLTFDTAMVALRATIFYCSVFTKRDEFLGLHTVLNIDDHQCTYLMAE